MISVRILLKTIKVISYKIKIEIHLMYVLRMCVCVCVIIFSLSHRLWASPGSEGGEGCGHWSQRFHPVLEESTRGIWVQNHLGPLPR